MLCDLNDPITVGDGVSSKMSTAVQGKLAECALVAQCITRKMLALVKEDPSKATSETLPHFVCKHFSYRRVM